MAKSETAVKLKPNQKKMLGIVKQLGGTNVTWKRVMNAITKEKLSEKTARVACAALIDEAGFLTFTGDPGKEVLSLTKEGSAVLS